MKLKCCDCGMIFDVPDNTEEHEIISCPCCSTEYIFENGQFRELDFDEQEDWGE
jgi:uncharacterized paraquat-inducible protein A